MGHLVTVYLAGVVVGVLTMWLVDSQTLLFEVPVVAADGEVTS